MDVNKLQKLQAQVRIGALRARAVQSSALPVCLELTLHSLDSIGIARLHFAHFLHRAALSLRCFPPQAARALPAASRSRSR